MTGRCIAGMDTGRSRDGQSGMRTTGEGAVASSGEPADMATGQAVVEALHAQRGAKVDDKNRRDADRYPWVTQLHVRIVDLSGNSRDIDVTTHDLSVGGFSFLHSQFLHNGTIILTRIKSLPHQPTLMCIVRNCTHVKGATHRVGVRFEKASTDGKPR